MGAWGTALYSNDTASDIRGDMWICCGGAIRTRKH